MRFVFEKYYLQFMSDGTTGQVLKLTGLELAFLNASLALFMVLM
jgi:hypothetical protein